MERLISLDASQGEGRVWIVDNADRVLLEALRFDQQF
jgi:hypothetical protein